MILIQIESLKNLSQKRTMEKVFLTWKPYLAYLALYLPLETTLKSNNL